MHFSKYQALGNDYLVIEPESLTTPLKSEQIIKICDRHYGVGADGILLGPSKMANGAVGLRIFNPDGSEAEKSGNGLRIFARYLWDKKLVTDKPFKVTTSGGMVTCHVKDNGESVTVQMGRVSFHSEDIPVIGPEREVLNEEMTIAGQRLMYCAATIGNPHCVILCDSIVPEKTRQLGPLIEREPRFPHRTNVQFMKTIDRANIQIDIWERGAGYTLASGSSSTAAAAVAYKLGFCSNNITVHMPGGELTVAFDSEFNATMTGPATHVCNGNLDDKLFKFL